MDKYRVIALDGSPKAGKTELAKRIIVCLKAKGYHPVVIESSNSFFSRGQIRQISSIFCFEILAA